MSGRVIITVEYADPTKPGKSTKPLWPDEAIGVMRDICFRVAVGEYTAAYLSSEQPLNVKGPTT